MITIYSNWTGNALVTGDTLDEARSKLNEGYCDKLTKFGSDVTDVTALETTYADTFRLLPLSAARRIFPVVLAHGLARMPFAKEG